MLSPATIGLQVNHHFNGLIVAHFYVLTYIVAIYLVSFFSKGFASANTVISNFIISQSFVKRLITNSSLCSFKTPWASLKNLTFSAHCAFKRQEIFKLLSDVDFVSHDDGNIIANKIITLIHQSYISWMMWLLIVLFAWIIWVDGKQLYHNFRVSLSATNYQVWKQLNNAPAIAVITKYSAKNVDNAQGY